MAAKKKLPNIPVISPQDMRIITKFIPGKEPILKGKRVIPVCEPDLSGNEKKYLNMAFDSSWISWTGSFVNQFESIFAEKVSQTKFAVATNSGTTALHLALSTLGINKNDEVILPAFTMIATINAVSYCGAKSVLVDVNRFTWNIDPDLIEDKINNRTKAIIVVHAYGLPANMPQIKKIADKYKLWLIEDAAEAHGGQINKKRIGSWGDVACFSFYANKIIATGEGGMVVTDNEDIYKRSRQLVNQGVKPGGHFWHEFIGFGYRMTNLQAAIGVAQTEKLNDTITLKRRNAELYKYYLKNINGITLPVELEGYKNVYWMYGICIDQNKFGITRDELREKLASAGIETRTFFIPLHFQPAYHELFRKERYPISEQLSRDGLYLPSSVKLKEKDIEFISKKIIQSSKQKNKE